VYSQIAIVRQSLANVHLLFDVDASVVLVGRDLDRGLQELRAPLEGPERDVDHAVHELAHERVGLLELNKSNRARRGRRSAASTGGRAS
jgi:hypothetical protein